MGVEPLLSRGLSDAQASGAASSSSLVGLLPLATLPLLEDSEWQLVYHRVSARLYVVGRKASRAACGWWSCGTPDELATNADFSVAQAQGYIWCPRCADKWNGVVIG